MCLNLTAAIVLIQVIFFLRLPEWRGFISSPSLPKETNMTLLFLQVPWVLVWSCWWLSRNSWIGPVPLVVTLWHLLFDLLYCSGIPSALHQHPQSKGFSCSLSLYSWAFSQFRHCQSCLTSKPSSLLQAILRTGSFLEFYYILCSVCHRWCCWI